MLFELLGEKFKPQQNEPILSSQYCKLVREEKESDEDWMGQLRIKQNEHEYREGQEVKEQFVIGNNDGMMTGIIKE